MATYGNKGNRWWVGLNVGSDQSTILGTSSLFSPVGYESLPSGDAVDDAKFAAAAGKVTTISVENVNWYNINGPYVTQAQANAAIPAIQKAHPAPGEASQVVDAATGQPQSANSVSNPLDFLKNVAGGIGEIGDVVHTLTEANTWIRIAKVVAGGLLLLIGLAHITGAENKVASIARKIPVIV
jgi:hypothetical protein